MGKAKKKRGSSTRVDPIGLDVVLQEDEMLAENLPTHDGNNVTEQILEQLQSVNPEDRICGCMSISQHSATPLTRQQMLTSKLVRVTGPLLLDDDPNVCQAAAGALRNLSSCNMETTEEMVSQDVMTPLVTLVKKWHQKQQQEVEIASKDKSVISSILVESTNLIFNLVEASPTALNIFNRENLIEVIISQLSSACSTGTTSSTANEEELIVACLNTLSAASDDNPAGSSRVANSSDCQQVLQQLLHGSDYSLAIRIGACLVLATAGGESLVTCPWLSVIFSTLSESLNFSPRQAAMGALGGEEVKSNGAGAGATAVDEGEEMMELEGEDNSPYNQEDKKFKEFNKKLRCQQTGLEILANLSTLSGGDSQEEDEWVDENGDDEDCDENGGANSVESGHMMVSPQVVEGLTSQGLISLVMDKIQPLEESVTLALNKSKKGTSIIEAVDRVRSTALICMSNFADGITVDDFGGAHQLYDLWVSLGTHCVQSQGSPQKAILEEAASGCMRSLTSKICADPEASQLLKLAGSDVEALLNLGQQTESVTVKINLINIIGDLALLSAKSVTANPASAEGLGVLGSWLVKLAKQSDTLEVTAEALDRTFDAFAEDDTDAVFIQHNLLPLLKQAYGSLEKRLTAAEKRRLGKETAGLVNMARLNLKRFIKYKEKRPGIGRK